MNEQEREILAASASAEPMVGCAECVDESGCSWHRVCERNTVNPVAYVNGDELDNMLDDRVATIQGKPDGWRKTPLYAAPRPIEAPAQAVADSRDAARYRHLRRNATSRFGRQPNDDEFDAMIDAAIEKESK